MSRTDAIDPTRHRPPRLPRLAAQIFAVVGGQAAWGIAVLVAYPVVAVACAAGQPIFVHLVRWVALLVALAAVFTGYRVWSRVRAYALEDLDDVGRERVHRVRFMGFGGMLLSAAGAFLLVVEDLATWVIDPCL